MSLLRFLLFPFSLIYFIGLLFDRWTRSRNRAALPKPVISIGNMTLGGTGKTPLLIRLANEIKNRGLSPVILSRGYGEDEIRLMREKCTDVAIGVGANRVKTARELLKTRAIDVFLLDDGFQHWPLARQLDIVCVDATRPFKGDVLVPAGRLREPLCGIRRAEVVVLTRTELISSEEAKKLTDEIQKMAPSALVLSSFFEKRLFTAEQDAPVHWDTLRAQRVVAVSAIGNPAAFEADLKKENIDVHSLRFRDHREYSDADARKILDTAKKEKASVVTTEKDWIKLKKFDWKSVNIYISKIETSFSPEDETRWTHALEKVLP